MYNELSAFGCIIFSYSISAWQKSWFLTTIELGYKFKISQLGCRSAPFLILKARLILTLGTRMKTRTSGIYTSLTRVHSREQVNIYSNRPQHNTLKTFIIRSTLPKGRLWQPKPALPINQNRESEIRNESAILKILHLAISKFAISDKLNLLINLN